MWIAPQVRARSQRRFHFLFDDDSLVARDPDFDALIAIFVARAQFAIADDDAGTYVFLHAGAVEIDNAAVLLPGEGGSGKSTLVAALLRAGARFLADDMVAIDEASKIHPCPGSINLRTTAGHERLSPTDLGAGIAPRAVPVGAVVATQWRAERLQAPPVFVTMSPANCLLALASNASSARRVPEKALDRMAVAVRGTTRSKGILGLSGPRGDASVTAVAIIELVRDFLGGVSDAR